MRFVQYFIKDFDTFKPIDDTESIIVIDGRYRISRCHEIAVENNGNGRDFFDAYQIFTGENINNAKPDTEIISINNNIKMIEGIKIDRDKIYHCVIVGAELRKAKSGRYFYVLQYIIKNYPEKIFFHSLVLGSYKDYKEKSQNMNKKLWHLTQNKIKRFGFKFKQLRELDVFGFNFEATLNVTTYLGENLERKPQLELIHII